MENFVPTNETPKRVTRRSRSYAETVSNAQVMVTALKANAEAVAKRGINAAFVTALEENRATAITYNDEQEKLKADLKLKTEALNTKIKEITAQLAEARKVVKLAIPKAQWKEFGMDDKR
ncbi:MAG: hypothetical protein ACTTKN_08930 [Phocaeicola sp.]|uniref:hypothetical protein n=1 Tax=Phocaeicola sp. TaxID=2773926 RepID=UPI003FA112B5